MKKKGCWRAIHGLFILDFMAKFTPQSTTSWVSRPLVTLAAGPGTFLWGNVPGVLSSGESRFHRCQATRLILAKLDYVRSIQGAC